MSYISPLCQLPLSVSQNRPVRLAPCFVGMHHIFVPIFFHNVLNLLLFFPPQFIIWILAIFRTAIVDSSDLMMITPSTLYFTPFTSDGWYQSFSGHMIKQQPHITELFQKRSKGESVTYGRGKAVNNCAVQQAVNDKHTYMYCHDCGDRLTHSFHALIAGSYRYGIYAIP